jgi:endogenous inhibitor of DNA gyrase (YacG/DUF329 family)
MNRKVNYVKCPQCGTPVIWDKQSLYRPFCSKKCQLIDFGSWANEEKQIPGAPDMSDGDQWSEQNTSI